MSGALLDTSVIIAAGDAGLDLPETAAISVISFGELHAGVLRAPDERARSRREARFAAIRALFDPLLVDAEVARHYGEALATARDQGRIEKATDLLIVATAAATGRTLVTLDDRQARLAHALDVPAHHPR